MSFADYLIEDARLTMLKALREQRDGRLNETIMMHTLDTFGHRRSREWVRTQLRKLEELGAVVCMEAGSVIVATITRTGIDHLELRATIDGVAKPSPFI